MTHEDSGHYAAKHPPGTQVSEPLREAVKAKLSDDGTIACAVAHDIAQSLNVAPRDVGIAIDLQEGRIVKCQMGLFGYAQGQKMIKAAESVDPQLQQAVQAALVNDRLPCAEAWRLARENNMPKLAVANACETLGVKIKPCQIGAF